MTDKKRERRGLNFFVWVAVAVLIIVAIIIFFSSNNIMFSPKILVDPIPGYPEGQQGQYGEVVPGGAGGNVDSAQEQSAQNYLDINCISTLGGVEESEPIRVVNGYIVQGERRDCAVVALLNANLQRIYNLNPGLTPDGQDAIAETLLASFNIWKNYVNEDDDPTNNIDTNNNGVALDENDPEFKEIMHCKSFALNGLRGRRSLVMPTSEELLEVANVIYSTVNDIVRNSDWKMELDEALRNNHGAVMALGNHAFTVVSVNCDTNPPTITLRDPRTGALITFSLTINSDGSATVSGSGTTYDGATVDTVVIIS